eukprot:5021891-Pyramimonas_sp.AAC.1
MSRVVLRLGKDLTPMGYQCRRSRFWGGTRGPALVQYAEQSSPPPHEVPPTPKSHQPPSLL